MGGNLKNKYKIDKDRIQNDYAIIEHSKDINELLKKIYKKFNPPTESAFMTPEIELTPHTYNRFPELKENPLYDDFIKIHLQCLPEEYRSLPDDLEVYNNSFIKFKNLKFRIYDQIKSKACKRTNLIYDSYLNKEHAISEFFIKQIYIQKVMWNNYNRLARDKNDLVLKMTPGMLLLGAAGLVSGNDKELIMGKEIFENMMLDTDYLNKNKDKIDLMVKEGKKFLQIEDKISKILDKLLLIKIFPGDCIYLYG